MMYIHYCKYCRRIHMLNGHKKYCPGCKGHLAELKISYLKYVNMPPDERKELRLRLSDPAHLEAFTAAPKKSCDYAKWLQLSLSANVKHDHSKHYAAYSH